MNVSFPVPVIPNMLLNMFPMEGTNAAASKTKTNRARAPKTIVFKGKPWAFMRERGMLFI